MSMLTQSKITATWSLHLIASLMLALAAPAAELAWDNPSPRALFYAGFDDSKKPVEIGTISHQQVVLEPGKFGSGLVIAKGTRGGSALAGPGHQLDPRRGSATYWLKLNTAAQTHGPPEIFGVWPGPPEISAGFRAQQPKLGKPGEETPGEIYFSAAGQRISSGDFPLVAGQWHHVVWTWWGLQHCIYVDGKLKTEKSVASPMVSEQSQSLRIGVFNGGDQDITLDELAIYNVVLNADEVDALFKAQRPGPLTRFNPRPIEIAAQWAPGEAKVHLAADAGNSLTTQTDRFLVTALNAAGAVVGRAEIFPLHRGFGETVLSLGTMPPGRYHVTVTALDVSGRTLATKSSEPYELPRTKWLGNDLGKTDTIQPPWTPIQRDGKTLKVWGRSHALAGGFGLPQQITSAGKPMLARPIELEIEHDGRSQPIQGARLSFDTLKPHEANWTGSASAGGVQIHLRGRLEYDGLLKFTLRLTPAQRPVEIQALRLQMAMPAERALFLHTTGDQTYWWYTYKACTATNPGVFHDNLKQQFGSKATFLPVVLFSDHERGLEWFAENISGWQVDDRKPIQQMIRDPDGVVRLESQLANQPFTLDRPIEITFGLMATPVKPLPPDWRTAYVDHHPLPLKSDLAMWWLWPDAQGKDSRQGAYNLCPVDLETWRRDLNRPNRTGIKIAPFVNAHVLIPHPPDDWPGFNHILQAETQNDGWIAQPTSGFRDYWTYQLNRWLDADGLDGIYIDESYAFGANASLLGGGYVRADGTHGLGFNLLGLREQLKRTRQIFLDHHKRPLVWLHTTANMWPHAWAFADVVTDGEGFEFNQPAAPDFIDLFGGKLLEASAGRGATGGPWLLSIGRAQKFGFVPVFLNRVKFYNQPEYPQAMRTQHGLLTLLDIIPMSYHPGQLAQAKQAFGIGASDVRFHGYWDQTAVDTGHPEVKASYYSRSNSLLIVVVNLGNDSYEGTLRLNSQLLGGNPSKWTLRDAESGQHLSLSNGTCRTSILRHDFRLIQLDDTGQEP